jgi:hypothetical protein
MDPLLLHRFVRASNLLVMLLISTLRHVHADLVVLTDATFEHQTQASTGATTGSWLVLFSIPSCTSCQQIFRPILETLGQDEALYERGIVLGSVDCTESTSVCRRFGVTQLPTVVYLHQKKLYTFDISDDATTTDMTQDDKEEIARQIKQFVLNDFNTMAAAIPVPDPPSVMDAILMIEPLSKLYDACTKSPLLGIAIVTMASMLFLTLMVLVYVLVRGTTTDTNTSKNKTKKS